MLAPELAAGLNYACRLKSQDACPPTAHDLPTPHAPRIAGRDSAADASPLGRA